MNNYKTQDYKPVLQEQHASVFGPSPVLVNARTQLPSKRTPQRCQFNVNQTLKTHNQNYADIMTYEKK